MSLAAELKQRALESGADLAGIAPAEPLAQAALLSGRLARGLPPGLAFLGRDPEVRQDIRRWHPAARSVLVCGFAYGGERDRVLPGHGRIARYARNADYHRELRARLESVVSWLRRHEPGADGRVFVDTSPVLERLYGAAAGLGWIGRSGLLVSQAHGSFFLIAGAAINRELEPDRPLPDRCASCRRCLEACPAGALQERALDAGRCSAYLTIEHRGAIPQDLRAGVGCWAAGCDLCQEACPFNERARPGRALKPVLPAQIPLETLASLDEAAFRERFASTPLARLKRRGLVRNALLAMGNSGQGSFRPLLEGFSSDPDPVLREQALWSLGRLPGGPAGDPICEG